MDPHFAMGIFALYVVIVSLVRSLASREFPRLTAMKKAWGRSRGMLLHFLANVALPLVLGIVFMSRGVVSTGAERTVIEGEIPDLRATICALTASANGPETSFADALHESSAPPFEPAAPWPHVAGSDNLPMLPP